MVRKCPKGVFCIENTTIIFLTIFVIFFIIIIFQCVFNTLSIIKKEYLAKYIEHPFSDRFHFNTFPKIGAGISNHPRDILSNPYLPPLSNSHYFPKNSSDPRGIPPHGIPINIATRGPRTEWKQIGLLTRLNGEETILALMGRPLYTNRQKWQYYTLSDKNNSVKLPISKNGKSCTGDYGCDEIFSGDNLFVEGYNDAFKATVYENNTLEYIPF